MTRKTEEQYADIIHLPHHVSKRHPQMSMADRAAQFSPFAALTGHDEAIAEAARITEQRPFLDTEHQQKIYISLQNAAEQGKPITITYFIPDKRKTGGCIEDCYDCIKRLDTEQQLLILQNGTPIPVDNVLAVMYNQQDINNT